MNLVNWQNVFDQSEKFKSNPSTKWAFIEGFLNDDFYNKLQKSFPKFDSSWDIEDSYDKLAYRKYWKMKENRIISKEKDERYSEDWNQFMEYAWSKEFCEKIVEFSGVKPTNLKNFVFMTLKKNGFQLPHTHNVSDQTLMIFLYLSKGWKQGDPGGTYLSDGNDESKILFEPYNLENSALIVLDGPNAAHGVRQITNDVERKAIQLTYEPFSTKSGWYSDSQNTSSELLDL